MNDNDLEKQLQSYYTTFTPESSTRAVAGVDRTLADRRSRPARPLTDWAARLSLRGVGALAGLAVVLALVVALFPLWGRTGIGPATNGSAGPGSAEVDQAGVARDGSVWAVRGQGISISRDYGQTWTEHELPVNLAMLGSPFVGDADHIWVLGSRHDASSTHSDNLGVYRSSDGGATWQATWLYASLAASPTITFNWQIRFVDDSVGFLVLSDALASGTGTIMRTEDGGATWDPTGTITTAIQYGAASSPDPGSSPDSSGSFWFSTGPVIPVDANTLWSYCGIPVVALPAGSCPLLQVSRDAGASWTAVTLPGLGGTGNEALAVLDLSGTVPNGVQFISPTEGYVAVQETLTSNYIIHYYRTTDGGRTWSEVASTDGQQVAVPPIFIDSQHWFQGGLETVVIPNPSPNATNGFIVSQDFVTPQGVNVTSDGGKTWKNVAASLGSIYELWMSDAQHGAGIVSGNNGSILYLTSDGWETWREASIGPAQWPNQAPAGITAPPLESGTPAGSPSAARSADPSALPSVTLPATPSDTPAATPSESSSGSSSGS